MNIPDLLCKDGKLKEELRPAIYIDSTVLIEYWKAESIYIPEEKEFEEILNLERDEFDDWLNNQLKNGSKIDVDLVLARYNNPEIFFIRDLFRHDTNLKKIIKIRDKILYEKTNVFPVFTPLALNELIKWNAEVIFKQISSEAIGTKNVQRESVKNIGEKLKNIWERWDEFTDEEKNYQNIDWKKEGVRRLIPELMINPSFTYAHGLKGLIPVDILNFNYSMKMAWSETSGYSYLQLGATDIMHIIYAKHLGCDYIASLDSDFQRARKAIKKATGIEVLYRYDEILDIL